MRRRLRDDMCDWLGLRFYWLGLFVRKIHIELQPFVRYAFGNRDT
jgi:hypothetical protein